MRRGRSDPRRTLFALESPGTSTCAAPDMSNPIVRLDATLAADISEPPADRLVAGTPELRVQNYFTDGTQQFFAGRWAATRGKWRVRYTENELCVMTAG